MSATIIHARRTDPHAAQPIVTFTDEYGDTTTGHLLAVEDGARQPVVILTGGRIVRRATRLMDGSDRAFTLTAAVAG